MTTAPLEVKRAEGTGKGGNMNKIEQVINAFRKARLEGEELLRQERISWEDYAFVMLGFEAELRALEEDL